MPLKALQINATVPAWSSLKQFYAKNKKWPGELFGRSSNFKYNELNLSNRSGSVFELGLSSSVQEVLCWNFPKKCESL